LYFKNKRNNIKIDYYIVLKIKYLTEEAILNKIENKIIIDKKKKNYIKKKMKRKMMN